ncbi:hypothetical protein POTOM_016890 [Populus tomentosa]|uniref:NAC domain-containing protein n=1 Tax=Populus tomentosa TaxID=118781 RepID=A0A8X7ZU20_POPTO|nr:hypothetical protein POTOM_016890 [Populus tomentosa]
MERMNMSSPELPPGFRFHPTDQELIIHYLKKKVSSSSYPEVSIIADVDIYKFNPWDLPAFQEKPCLGRMSGFSLALEIGNIPMVSVQTEQQDQVTGKQQEPINQSSPPTDHSALAFGCLQGQEMFKKSSTLKDYYYDLQPCLMAPPESKEADEQELVEFQEVSLGYPISGVDSNSQPTMVSTVKERLEYIKKILSIGAFEELVPATPKKRLHASSSNKAENECLFEDTLYLDLYMKGGTTWIIKTRIVWN